MYFFAFFRFGCTLKERKLARGQVPQWLSGSVLTLQCICYRFAPSPSYHYVFKFLKVFLTVFCKLGLSVTTLVMVSFSVNIGFMGRVRVRVKFNVRLRVAFCANFYSA